MVVCIHGRHTLLYKADGADDYRKILYTHLLDDKKQDSSTIRCNIEHVFNDLDENKTCHTKYFRQYMTL